MAEGENIKLFDAYAGSIFDKLYKSFPKCVMIETLKEVEKIKISSDTSSDEKAIVFSETLLWLANNGFIKYKTSQPNSTRPIEPMIINAFYCTELTVNGLNLLSSPLPEALKGESVGKNILKQVKAGMYTEAGKTVTRAIFAFGANNL